MILVNNNGDPHHAFPTLLHSRWNGCTLADVVFPSFLFIAGTSLVLSFRVRLQRGATRGDLARHTLQRAVIIFLLGLFVNGFPSFPWETYRIYGVLQRIAICLVLASFIFLYARTRTIAVLLAGLLLGYWVLLRYVPVPGSGVPGRDVPFLDPFANIVAYTDRHLLPARHLYRQSFYDPEGLLSSLSALASTLLGVLTGQWLVSSRENLLKLKGLLLSSALCLISGALWSLVFPLNKRLWTSSFVLFCGGITLLAFSILYWLLDVRSQPGRWSYPAIVFGSNALAAYVFSEMLAPVLGILHIVWKGNRLRANEWAFEQIASFMKVLPLASLVYSLLFVVLCFLSVWLLYRKRIFLKV
jgi:predicted acyltransferase